MTTLVEHIIVAGAKNHPPMLEKSMYDSQASRIRLFIKGVKHATNIILHGLPPDVYALVNHQESGKDIWDKVKLLVKGIEPSYQERECRLYNLFDKFTSVQGETLYEYYWRFSQLINDTHTIGMTMQQVYVNTKFLNALPPEWSKFITDVKLAKSLYTTTYDQLYAYLSQHECHAQVERVMRERYPDPFALGEDSINFINKALEFMSVVASREIATTSKGNYATGQPRVVKCYNCQGEGHMARQCSQPKRLRNSAWFKEKLMLDEAQEAGQILDEEQLAFLADLGMDEALVDVQEMLYSKQTHIVDLPNNEIHSDKNIILYSQYLQETQNAEDFGKLFVTQQELSAEQAFWLKHSSISKTPVKSHTPVRVEAPSELHKVYKLKQDKNGAIACYKARFIAKGFQQQGNNKGTIDNIISQLGFAFALKGLGSLNYFLGNLDTSLEAFSDANWAGGLDD
nr:hypothetical protein [Tanacetum cinerariifolium]